jgi:NADH-quinone oxidoreductase subunit N
MLLLFLLSLAGIPPTGGFLGKFFVFGAAIQSQLLFLAIVAIVNSAIAAFYYLNVVRTMFLQPAPEGQASAIAVTPAMQATLWACAVMTLLIGLYAQPFIEWAMHSATLLAATP